MFRFCVALSLGALLFVLPLAAQDDPYKVKENVDIALVEVPVNVVDRDGQPVRGLTQANFRVYDDGEARAITHFEEIDLAKISVDPEILTSPVARRHFMLVFDFSNSSPKSLIRARNAAHEFLDGILENDLVSISTFSVEEGFGILTGFTTDREMIRLAIAALDNLWFYESGDPLLLASSIAPGMGDIPVQDVEVNQDRGFQETQEVERQAMQWMEDRYRRSRVKKQIETFGVMAKFLDRIKGRKHVVLLSEGFDSSLIQGRERPLSQEQQATEMLWLASGQIWRVNNDERFGHQPSLTALQDMGELFRRSDVMLHSIDIRGVAGSSDARTGSQSRSNESHFLLARPTGGRVFKNSNDIGANFSRLLKQQEVVYVLGFQTEPSGTPGNYHDLKVKVDIVGHRGLQVAHRAGYYDPSPYESLIEERFSVMDIMMNSIPQDAVEVNLLTAPFMSRDQGSQVLVIAEINGADLVRQASGEELNAELFVYAFDEDNRARDFIFQTMSFDLSSVGSTLKNGGVKYYGVLNVPAGHYAIKSLVRVKGSGQSGFRVNQVDVPSLDEAAVLPPLVFEETGGWVMLRAAKSATGEISYPFVLGDESFVPSARPRMNAEGEYKVALFTYNLDFDAIELVATLQGVDGTIQNPDLRVVGRTEADATGMAKLLLDFSPRMLAPGNYSLHVAVRGGIESSPSEVSLPFTIAATTERPAGYQQ